MLVWINRQAKKHNIARHGHRWCSKPKYQNLFHSGIMVLYGRILLNLNFCSINSVSVTKQIFSFNMISVLNGVC